MGLAQPDAERPNARGHRNFPQRTAAVRWMAQAAVAEDNMYEIEAQSLAQKATGAQEVKGGMTHSK